MKQTITVITMTAALLIPAAAAHADHAYGGDIAIRALAEDVAYFAGDVYRDARHLARDRHDRRAVKALRDLDRDARHFNRQARRYYRDPLHTARDFERLRVSFYVAHDYLPGFYGYASLERGFYALADSLRRLEYAFRDVGYRYRRPLPRLHFSINLGVPFHHPRGHRVYRKRHGHGYRWFSSIDLRHYDKPRHHKRHYKKKHFKHRDRHRRYYNDRDGDRHHRYDRRDQHERKHYKKRGRSHHKYENRDLRRGRRHDRYDKRDHDDDDRGRRHRDRRRGSARDTRPRR